MLDHYAKRFLNILIFDIIGSTEQIRFLFLTFFGSKIVFQQALNPDLDLIFVRNFAWKKF
jgi:hypothetical protein